MRPRDIAIGCALLLSAQCKREPGSREAAAHPARDGVPFRTGAIKLDGEWDEEDWAKRALRGQFVDAEGALARPSSEVRLLHDDTDLIVALYAADEDIEHGDAFDFSAGALSLHVDATGMVTPAIAGVRAAVDYDEGTLDNPGDDDEEWVVELAIPLAALGIVPGGHLPVRAARCDVPKDKIRRCAAWSANLTIEATP